MTLAVDFCDVFLDGKIFVVVADVFCANSSVDDVVMLIVVTFAAAVESVFVVAAVDTLVADETFAVDALDNTLAALYCVTDPVSQKNLAVTHFHAFE